MLYLSWTRTLSRWPSLDVLLQEFEETTHSPRKHFRSLCDNIFTYQVFDVLLSSKGSTAICFVFMLSLRTVVIRLDAALENEMINNNKRHCPDGFRPPSNWTPGPNPLADMDPPVITSFTANDMTVNESYNQIR